MDGLPQKGKRIGRASRRESNYLAAIIHVNRIAVVSAQGPKIHGLSSFPERGVANRGIDERINFARCRGTNHPATSVDSSDVRVLATGEGAKIGKDTFIPPEHVRDEASRGTIAIVGIWCRQLRFPGQHSLVV